MTQPTSPLATLDLTNKRIFLRADLNVPLYNGSIVSDLRLQALKPTLDLILNKSGKIILATHIDRPKAYDPTLSTHLLLPWFASNGYTVIFEPDLKNAYTKSFGNPKTIVLLDNLRFFPGEQTGDTQLAQQLARLGDYYVNDAFGMLHRTDCSVYAVPQLFTPDKRMIGLLIEKELANAQQLLNPIHPFTVIIGGNKIKDKIPLIDQLLEKIDNLLICPALSFTFLKAENQSTGLSLVDDQSINHCKTLLEKAKQLQKNIILPLDYVVSHDTFKGPFYVTTPDKLTENDFGITIGPASQELFGSIISQSKTIFYNGLMGSIEHFETLSGVQSVFQEMAHANGYSTIAGGDSTAAAQLLGFSDKVDYLSTGGGALLAYLGNQTLPALQLLLNK